MAAPLTGTDDMGPWIDTGCATTPTKRPSTDVSFNTVVSVPDPDRADKKPVVETPRRSATQRR